MARDKGILANIDNADLVRYPNGRIKNNTGAGDGTPVDEYVYGDLHEMKDKIMRMYGISHNNLPDNEVNGYQLVEALIALASKNDFVLDLTDSDDKFVVPLKLSKLKNDESFILKAGADKGVQTQIRGSLDATEFLKPITYLGDFKANEYVRMINTASAVVLIRMVDSFNLDAVASDLNYLKKASQAEETAGTEGDKATTPAINKVTLTRRINGDDSADYLATDSRNGVYPKEHFEIVENLNIAEVVNRGFFTGFNVGNVVGTNFSTGGDISTATVTLKTTPYNKILVTMANAMAGTDYLVKMFVQSNATGINDGNILTPSFKPVNTTQFEILMGEVGTLAQDLKIHIEVINL